MKSNNLIVTYILKMILNDLLQKITIIFYVQTLLMF